MHQAQIYKMYCCAVELGQDTYQEVSQQITLFQSETGPALFKQLTYTCSILNLSGTTGVLQVL